MKLTTALLTLLFILTGCATSTSRWEVVAAGAALADIGSTGAALSRGGEEGNPVYGRSPSFRQMLVLNAAAGAGTWAMTRHLSRHHQQQVWRNVAVLRLLVTAWNLSQSGCACFKFSF